VDGVALKQAVDAFVTAPDAEKAARFASAEVIRWLEWGVRSYQSFMLGLSLILFAIVIVSTARIPRPIGYLIALSGLSYIVQGWVLGSEGFSAANSSPTLLGNVLVVAWSIWLLAFALRMKAPVETATG
jgi:sulfite exporter TauE/SafE